jgi:hypothetical protein
MPSAKKKILYLFVLMAQAGILHGQQTQPSQLFENFKTDKSRSLLPDFSYAGYHCGEKAIPDVKSDAVFNVLDFGAIPNDEISDRKAIQAAIDAANKKGSGIVFFPKGRFIVNDDSTLQKGIISKGSNIILRGSGSGAGGTELFMKETLVPQNPTQMWTGRPMFTMAAKGTDKVAGKVAAAAAIGEMELTLDGIGNIKEGDWIALKMLNNDAELIAKELAPYKLNNTWKYLVEKGVDVCMYYQVLKINNNTIRLHAPLAYAIDPKYNWVVYNFSHADEVGIEDIAFVGNWKTKFIHHGSWKHDSGFYLFEFSHCTNSWMRNCRFTDCNIAAIVGQSANVTVANCVVTGTPGHEAITSNHSTNVLLANLKDEASQWHSFGSSHGALNTVIWHCTYPSTTCFESHASQPRNTLLDNVTGGFMSGRQGGAIENLPNHLGGLVFWNYTQTSKPIKNFDFWPENEVWFKMSPPLIAGFKGNGTTFRKEKLGYLEGLDQVVSPQSLYEGQLQLRLKKIPGWLMEAKNVE